MVNPELNLNTHPKHPQATAQRI